MAKLINISDLPEMSTRKTNTVTCLDSSIVPTELGPHAFELENGVDLDADTIEQLKADALATYNFLTVELRNSRDENGTEFKITRRHIATDKDDPSTWSIFVRIDLHDGNSPEGVRIRMARRNRQQSIAASKEKNKSGEVTTRELTDDERSELANA